MPAPQTATAVEDIPQEFQETAQEPPQEAAPPPRSPLKKKPAGAAPDPNFFARVAAIPRDDWGNRVFLYLYVLEPLCDLKQSGGKTYLNRYSAPVKDEHQIMLEYGSGRYRLMLSMNKVSHEQSNEIARFEFEIYNVQYPPKVPRAAWVNDTRNAKWEALLPKEAPPAAAAGTLVDAMRLYGDIRREVRDEVEETEPAQQPTTTSEVLATMKAAKDLFAPAATAAAPAGDPFDTAKKIMDMRTNDPMIALLLARMDAQDKAAEAARQREYDLQRELRAIQTAPAAPAKGLLDQIVELSALGDKLKPLKEMLGFNGGSNGDAPRGRTTGMDLAREGISKFFESPLADGAGQLLGAMATKIINQNSNGAQAMNPAPQNGVQPRGDDMGKFIENVLNPALLSHYVRGLSGSDFAAWLADGYPDRVIPLQNFTHPFIPGKRGAPAIIEAYKHTPSMWPALSSQGEPAFIAFVEDFCSWKVEAEEAIDAEVIHSEGPESEETPERI